MTTVTWAGRECFSYETRLGADSVQPGALSWKNESWRPSGRSDGGSRDVSETADTDIHKHMCSLSRRCRRWTTVLPMQRGAGDMPHEITTLLMQTNPARGSFAQGDTCRRLKRGDMQVISDGGYTALAGQGGFGYVVCRRGEPAVPQPPPDVRPTAGTGGHRRVGPPSQPMVAQGGACCEIDK